MTDHEDSDAIQTGLNAYGTPDQEMLSNGAGEEMDALALGMQLLAETDSQDRGADPDIQQELEVVKPHIDNITAFMEHIEAQGHSRAKVFRDWIDVMLTALKGDDEEYDKKIEPYIETARFETDDDRHPVSQFSKAMGDVLASAEKSRRDILGDVYMQLGQRSDELAQHFTPHSVADMMAGATLSDTPQEPKDDADGPIPGLNGVSVADPACGSGRLLLGMARKIEQRDPTTDYWVYGRDLDAVCAKMTVLNLYFHGVDGVVVHGDTLKQSAYNAWAVTHNTGHSPRIQSLPAEAFDSDLPVEKESV